MTLRSAAFIASFPSVGDALDEARLDGQLGGGEFERLARDLDRHAVDFEHDAAGLDAAHPQLGRALAFAHAHLDRLLRHRHVGEDADPHAPGALHVARHGAARRLDLARGYALRLERLESVLAEVEVGRRGRNAVDAALVRLAELAPDRLQHGCRARVLLRGVAARTPGLALGEAFVLCHRIVLEDFALEDPYLHAAGAVGREGGGGAVVDVGPQRVQRHPAFAVPFHARDFGAAEPARAVDADAFGAETHCRLHGPLHGAPEGDAALELLRDRFGDQRRIKLGLADLDDVDDHVGVGQLDDFLAQLLDVGALLANDDAGPCRVNRHPGLLVRALDDDFRHRRLLEALHQLLADLHVLVQQHAVVVLAGVPARDR